MTREAFWVPGILLPLAGLVSGCGCGKTWDDEIDTVVQSNEFDPLPDSGEASEAVCEDYCRLADGGNVLDVTNCTLDELTPADEGDTAGASGHLTCTATVSFVCR